MPQVKPGDVVCIQAGVRSRLKFVGFKGTKDNPIIFKNCGGQVIFDKTVDNTSLEGSLIFEDSRYFRVTGTGSPNHKYGFYVRKTNGSALHATESDFEIDHVEIADAGFAGIFAKKEALCDNPEYHRGNFVMQNISIHDNYIHHTKGEGMYIGSSWYAGKDRGCGGKLYAPEIHGLRVFNNIVENTGADGIQIGCATKDVEVYNNTINGYGLNPFKPVQNNGLMLNAGCSGKYYNNKILNGTGMGLNCFGIGNVYMFNNLIVNAGYDGIFIDERSALLPGTGFHAHNNTIVTPKRDGIRINSRNSVGNTFINNLVVKPGSLRTNYYNKSQYLCVVDNTVDYSQKNNLFLPTVEEAKFLNTSGGDYQLKPESAAINKGATLTYFNFDFNKAARPNGGAFDIGAFEYTGNIRTTSNQAPLVSAGSNQTIILPTNTTTITGTATDSDGNITSVNWVKVSGPYASISGQTSKTLTLSKLVAGTYTYRFTATDNGGQSASSEVSVTVKSSTANTAPLVSAGTAKTITLPTNNTSLTGTATDADGTIASTVWTKVSGPSASMSGSTSLTLNLTNLVAGTYTFRLTARDNEGASSSKDVPLTVKAAVSEDNTDATTTTSMGAPSNLNVSRNPQGNAYLSWKDNSSDEVGFEVYMSAGNNLRFVKVGTTGSNKMQFTVISLPKNQNLYFKVRAHKRGAVSKFSNEVSLLVGVASSSQQEEEEEEQELRASGTNAFNKIMVNFNRGYNVPAPWNNFNVDPEPQDKLEDLKDVKGNITAVSITLLSPWGWAGTGSNGWNANGTTTGNNSGVFSDDVLKTSFWTERPEGEELLISGLTPDQYYSFTFFGSRNAKDSRITYYSIGKTSVSLDASMNTSKTATISGAKADARGNVRVFIHKDENSPYGYLNAMTIEASSSTAGGDMAATTDYKGTYTDEADSTSQSVSATDASIVKELFSAYPNPALDHIMIKYDEVPVSTALHIQVVDLTGNVRLSQEVSTTDINGLIRLDLDQSKFPAGYYLLRIISDAGQKTIKFIKI